MHIHGLARLAYEEERETELRTSWLSRCVLRDFTRLPHARCEGRIFQKAALGNFSGSGQVLNIAITTRRLSFDIGAMRMHAERGQLVCCVTVLTRFSRNPAGCDGRWLVGPVNTTAYPSASPDLHPDHYCVKSTPICSRFSTNADTKGALLKPYPGMKAVEERSGLIQSSTMRLRGILANARFSYMRSINISKPY